MVCGCQTLFEKEARFFAMAHAQFLQVIQALLVPDNAVRRQAETAYNQFVASSAEQASSLLLQLLQQAPDPQMRMLAAVLLRRRVNAPNKGACVLVRLDLSHVPAPLCVCFFLFVYPLDPPLPPYLCCFYSSLFLSPSLPL